MLRNAFLSLIFSTLIACDQAADQHAVFYVFGTTVEVTLRDTGQAQASSSFAQLQQRFQSMHRDWHAWEPGRLTDINQAFTESRKIELPADIASMIRRSQELELSSGGRFNPTIGGLIELWGFHTSDYPVSGPAPSKEAIEEWVNKKPSSLDIEISNGKVSSRNPAVQLDFGGIAKGYAVDIACTLLLESGIKSAIVSAGGDLRAFGGATKPWKIAVSKPGGGVIGGIHVRGDEAIFTSGVSQRYRQDQLERYPHILNPADGWPVNGLVAVTVITNEGMLADAAATALMVAGIEDWQRVAGKLGLDTVLVLDQSGNLFMTGNMRSRIKLLNDNAYQVSVVKLTN